MTTAAAALVIDSTPAPALASEAVTLTGYLGSDREIRWTPERTEIRKRRNRIALMDEEVEVTIPGRPYAVLSLATPERVQGQWKTTWHRLVCWNVYRTMEHIAVRLGRKGDHVQVQGHRETVQLETGKTLTQIVIDDFRILRHKIHEEQP